MVELKDFGGSFFAKTLNKHSQISMNDYVFK